MEEIIEILNEIDSDNSRFLKNVVNAYCSFTKERKAKMKNTQICIEDTKTDIENGIINLDEIDADKYFYTKMKLKQNNIVELLLNTKKEDLKNNKILRRIIYSKQKSQIIENKNRDLVSVIQELNERGITILKFVANNIDDINLFKEEQLKMAMEIIKTDEKEKYEKIYEYVCNYLKKDFISNNYCDFIHNKCIAQRRLHFYPIKSKNGCCFMEVKKCSHLKGGKCDTDCLACILFSCPYLSKRGVTYYGSEIPLLKAFFNRKQRKIIVFEFYKTKNEIIKKIRKIDKK